MNKEILAKVHKIFKDTRAHYDDAPDYAIQDLVCWEIMGWVEQEQAKSKVLREALERIAAASKDCASYFGHVFPNDAAGETAKGNFEHCLEEAEEALQKAGE